MIFDVLCVVSAGTVHVADLYRWVKGTPPISRVFKGSEAGLPERLEGGDQRL